MAAKNGREALEGLSKDDLVVRAEALGIDGARKFTKVELIDEISRASGSGERGLLGRARDLLRGVVEKSLGQPKTKTTPPPAAVVEVAKVVEPAPRAKLDTTPEPPVPTVTLAEIYLSQGHAARARAIAREVLREHPEDEAARTFLDKVAETDEKPARRVEAGALPDDPYERVGIEREAFIEPASQPPPEVPSMLDDAPFPARYDVDECVAMAVDPTTIYVYWETRKQSIERARRAMARTTPGDAKSVLRVLVVEPDERGPKVSTRDFEVLDLELGEWFVRDLPGASIVRAAIGLVLGERFLPLAHTLDIEAPADRPSQAIAREVVTWTEGGTRPAEGEAPRLTPLAALPRDAGGFGLPPMPEIPGEHLDARGLSSAELARRARAARSKGGGGRGPTSTSWLNR